MPENNEQPQKLSLKEMKAGLARAKKARLAREQAERQAALLESDLKSARNSYSQSMLALITHYRKIYTENMGLEVNSEFLEQVTLSKMRSMIAKLKPSGFSQQSLPMLNKMNDRVEAFIAASESFSSPLNVEEVIAYVINQDNDDSNELSDAEWLAKLVADTNELLVTITGNKEKGSIPEKTFVDAYIQSLILEQSKVESVDNTKEYVPGSSTLNV